MRLLKFTIVCFYTIMPLIISRVIFHYFLYLSNIIILHEVHLHAQQLHIPHSRIKIRKFCPTITGKYYWNDLPLSIRNKSSKILFKKALKKYYLAQYWLCACVCACVRVCVLMNNKLQKNKVNLVKGPWLVLLWCALLHFNFLLLLLLLLCTRSFKQLCTSWYCTTIVLLYNKCIIEWSKNKIK